MSQRVLVTCLHLQRHLDRYRATLAERGVEVEAPRVVQSLSEEELLPLVGRCDGLIAGDDHITARVLEAAVRLKVVVKWGIGTDAIDLAAARRLGIPVVNTPGVFADEVADVVIGYVILLARQLHRLDRTVREGGWLKVEGTSLRGRRLGVVGVGSIGRAVVQRARALGMETCGHDVTAVPDSFLRSSGMLSVELPELLATSDYVSLNCPLTRETHHLLDDAAFAAMKDGVRVINTGRGPLIDEAALARALSAGRVAGAALDVFEEEPLPTASPLLSFEQCIFGTHNASNTLDAVLRTNERALECLFRGLSSSGAVLS